MPTIIQQVTNVTKVVVPDFIQENSETLRAFLTSPQGFILGAVVAFFIDAIRSIVLAGLNGFIGIFEGSSVGSTAGTWGLVDLFRVGGRAIAASGNALRTVAVGVVETLNAPIIAAAENLGLAAPLVANSLLAIELVIAAYVAVLVANAVANTAEELAGQIPVIGAPLAALIQTGQSVVADLGDLLGGES